MILTGPPALVSGQESLPAPKAAGTPNEAAETAYQAGDFAKCIDLTTKTLESNPNDHLAMYLRASARVELGQLERDAKMVRAGIEDAILSLKTLNKLEPNYYLPYLYGMTTLSQIEDRPEHAETARKIADSLVTKTMTAQQKANIYYQRAVADVVLRKPEDAAKDYQSAIQAFPQHLGARIGLAEMYAVSNQPEKAIAAFNDTVQEFPKNPLVYNNRGLYLQQRGKTKEAYADFTKAIELDPEFAIAITNRGFTSLNTGQPAGAEVDFTAAIKIDPQQPLPYSLRGTSKLAQGNPQSALEDYETVLKLDPENPTALADIGFAKLFAGDIAGAYAAFEQACGSHPSLRYLNPWRIWTAVLTGQSDIEEMAAEAAKKPDDKREWADHLSLYLVGKESEDDLLAHAKTKDANLQSAQLCEAYYFMAEKKAQAGDKAAADGLYQQALSTKAINLSAYRGAQYALRKFGPSEQ
jgi:lipoprotein NlpI